MFFLGAILYELSTNTDNILYTLTQSTTEISRIPLPRTSIIFIWFTILLIVPLYTLSWSAINCLPHSRHLYSCFPLDLNPFFTIFSLPHFGHLIFISIFIFPILLYFFPFVNILLFISPPIFFLFSRLQFQSRYENADIYNRRNNQAYPCEVKIWKPCARIFYIKHSNRVCRNLLGDFHKIYA